MKFLLKFLFVLLFLTILLSLAGVLLPSSVRIEKDIWVRTSPDIVFSQISDISQWKKWLPWVQDTAGTSYQFSDKTNGVGATVTWSGEATGIGVISIEKAILDQSVACKINYDTLLRAASRFELASAGVGTRIKWDYSIDNLSYVNRYFMALTKHQVATSLEVGLQQLKEVAEDARLGRVVALDTIHFSSRHIIFITDSVPGNSFSLQVKILEDKLQQYAQRRNAMVLQHPFIQYHPSISDSLIKFSVVLPIDKKVWGWRETQYAQMPAANFIYADFAGLHSKVEQAYQAVEKYAIKNNFKTTNNYQEVFLVTSETDADTTKWLTRVLVQIDEP